MCAAGEADGPRARVLDRGIDGIDCQRAACDLDGAFRVDTDGAAFKCICTVQGQIAALQREAAAFADAYGGCIGSDIDVAAANGHLAAVFDLDTDIVGDDADIGSIQEKLAAGLTAAVILNHYRPIGAVQRQRTVGIVDGELAVGIDRVGRLDRAAAVLQLAVCAGGKVQAGGVRAAQLHGKLGIRNVCPCAAAHVKSEIALLRVKRAVIDRRVSARADERGMTEIAAQGVIGHAERDALHIQRDARLGVDADAGRAVAEGVLRYADAV